MTVGSHIRAVGPDAAQNAQSADLEHSGDEPLALQEEWQEDEAWDAEYGLETADAPDRSWIIPALAGLLVIGWTAAFIWPIRADVFAPASFAQWTDWISRWSLPVLLICTVWLLFMRNSKRESARFSDTASQLSRETADLENKLGTINRELSLAREFLGTQTRELESMGRVATERLSNHADTLQGLIQTNGDQVQAIASVSETALGNMEKLRDDLPVVANSARDVSNQIGNAGNTASEQLETLVNGFERLNDFGQASDRQVQSISDRIGGALASFETQLATLDDLSAERFDALKGKSEEFRADLDSREVDALAAMRRRADEVKAQADELLNEFTVEEEKTLEILKSRINTLVDEGQNAGHALLKAHDESIETVRQSKDRLFKELNDVSTQLAAIDERAAESSKQRMESLFKEATRFTEILTARDVKLDEDIAKRQQEFMLREEEASHALEQRLAGFDTDLSQRAKEHVEHAGKIVAQGEAIANSMFEFNALIETASALTDKARKQFSDNMSGLSDRIDDNESKLGQAKQSIGELTEDSIRLLEIIQSGARHSREDLPSAINEATEKLAEVEDRAAQLNTALHQATGKGDTLSEYLIASTSQVVELDQSMQSTNSEFTKANADHLAKMGTLKQTISELGEQSDAIAAKAQNELSAAIKQLEAATQSAFASLDAGLEKGLKGSAESISASAAATLEQSLQSKSEEAIARLEKAAATAASAGRDTARQLSDQLSKVNELTGNLEQRVARARQMAEDQIDNDFARRMALITESLNSNAIDISKSLSTDVTDTAWAAYLKGDRGIFTRRAVRLIDNTEARELAELYESDDNFREHVNRFIHDFEGMLRSVLSTRDGNALGVTVLGSDMGKLYVALAQAIDRLRN